MNNDDYLKMKIECKSCHKSYTRKTLEKYRGLYCKSCFYDILIKENCDYKKKLFIYEKMLIKNNIFFHDENFIGSGFYKFYNEDGIIIYDGEWEEGIGKKGKGKYYCNGILKYDGEWINNKRDGMGTEWYENNYMKYIGEWKDNMREGKGIYYSINGDTYDGEWKKGNMNGKGIYKYKSGDKYDGEWNEGYKQGKGILKYKRGDTYNGEWYQGKKNGKGIYLWISGDKYDGEWKMGRKQGKGVYYFSNGDKYDGEWDKGKKNGYGIEYTNGKIKKGIWENDKYLREKVEEEDQCLICYTNKKCYAFIPCGHLCMCEECHLKYQDDKCILCRKEFSISYKIYD